MVKKGSKNISCQTIFNNFCSDKMGFKLFFHAQPLSSFEYVSPFSAINTDIRMPEHTKQQSFCNIMY